MGAAVPDQLVDRGFRRPGLLVRALRRKGIENVGHRDDPAEDGDLFPREPRRISGAVEFLVVGKGDVGPVGSRWRRFREQLVALREWIS
jgi:hypothetical protein